MTKAEKLIDDQVHAAFKAHANCVQINMMDLGKVLDAGRNALKAGHNLDEAMAVAVAQYRKN